MLHISDAMTLTDDFEFSRENFDGSSDCEVSGGIILGIVDGSPRFSNLTVL